MGLRDVSDEELIERYCASPPDRDAGEELFDRYRPRVEKMSRALAHGNLCPPWYSRDVFAEDVISDTLSKLVDSICTFRFEAKFDTWLYSIVKREAIDVNRKLIGRGPVKREFVQFKGDHFCSKYRTNPFEVVRQREFRDITTEVLAFHAGRSQQGADSVDILERRIWDGLTAEQVAKKRHIAAETVSRKTTRDFKELRMLLEKRFGITLPRHL